MSDSQFDVVRRGAEIVSKEFSKKIGKYAKPYMRHLTGEILGAGVPAEYLQYAFREVFEGQRRWKVLPRIKSAVSAMNSVVVQERVLPNYDRNQVPPQDYSTHVNEAIVETGKWILSDLAKKFQQDYEKIANKQAVLAMRQMPDYSRNEWLEEYKETITESPSYYPNGGRVAEILYALLR